MLLDIAFLAVPELLAFKGHGKCVTFNLIVLKKVALKLMQAFKVNAFIDRLVLNFTRKLNSELVKVIPHYANFLPILRLQGLFYLLSELFLSSLVLGFISHS